MNSWPRSPETWPAACIPAKGDRSPRRNTHNSRELTSLSLSLFLLRAAREFTPSHSRTDDRVYLVKVMCTVSSAVVNKMYAGAERAREWRRRRRWRRRRLDIRYAIVNTNRSGRRECSRAHAFRSCVRALRRVFHVYVNTHTHERVVRCSGVTIVSTDGQTPQCGRHPVHDVR